jgi:hypothetical protein
MKFRILAVLLLVIALFVTYLLFGGGDNSRSLPSQEPQGIRLR